MEFLKEDNGKPYELRHRSYLFVRDLICFIKQCQYPKMFSSLFNQLVRSASSIGANLVEGKAGSTKKDWIRFYVIALRSANETKYWLCLVRDTMNVDRNKIGALLKEADEISKIIARIILNAGH